MKTHHCVKLSLLSLVVSLFFALPPSSFSQPDKMDSVGKGQVMDMLKAVKKAIKSDYYDTDPHFAGVDLETRFKAAEEKLKATESLGQAFAIIAQVVIDLNDSHTMFYPPARPAITEYGWRMGTHGDKTFITAVMPGSDADKKGLKIGDEVLKVNGFHPTRSELWKMLYYYTVISPKTTLNFEVKSPSGEVRQLQIATKVKPLKRMVSLLSTFDFNDAIREGEKRDNSEKTYLKEVGDDVLIWKLPSFGFDPNNVGGYIGRAKNKKTLILDLRGNPGGYVKTCEEMIGYFVDHDMTVAEVKGRKKMDPIQARSKGSNGFKGNLIVLVDAESASASEIFARTMQLQKRGIVIGDVSSGAVMQSVPQYFEMGDTKVVQYGMNLTISDVIMPDAQKLEHVGVVPDEVVVPTGQDLAERNDPVLARALELSGHKVEPSVAGKFFPAEKFIEHISNITYYGSYYVDDQRR